MRRSSQRSWSGQRGHTQPHTAGWHNRLLVGAVGLVLILGASRCVVERPIADTATKQSQSLDLFAVDCRAWQAGDRSVEAEASLIDFGSGEPELAFQWSFDDKPEPLVRERRPMPVGTPTKYRLVRRVTHAFEDPGRHRVTADVSNGARSATCTMTILVPGNR